MELKKIAFGGGCHWCTEAVFQSLIGIEKVAQGWVASTNKNSSFSEAVIVEFNKKIDIKTLIEIHLNTHKSTKNHAMRNKYRSAIYYFSLAQKEECEQILIDLQTDFSNKIITQILPFHKFKPSSVEYQNYYKTNPEKPFCKKYINPKLNFLITNFSKHTKQANSI
ncbi:peptide-methionine (S)-S-oxide reductase [Polaribacter sp.]|uniref:peptide-methionine (S)-S-oxide reductase n=1 Tax=Polaribacter sp. TaxID=1920175 RepID=UPI003F6CE14E